MTDTADITVRPFAAADQAAARRLILDGLGAHFGFVDETMNPDLNDIAVSYAGGVFLVAELRDRIVGTGALTRERDGVCRVQRMSTSEAYRRGGIGTALLTRLVEHARVSGYRSVVLETNERWDDAIGFYQAFGFRIVARGGGGVRFALAL